MKLCYIISEIDKAVYFEKTATELRKSGLDVTYILINCENGALAEFLTENQFSVYRFESPKISKSLNVISKVRKLLRQIDADVIHCHLASANWIGLWAGWLAGVKTRIYTRHSGEPLAVSWKEKVIDSIQNRLATTVVSISRNIDELLEKQRVSRRKRKLIHHGFDLQRFANNDRVEVGRIKKTYNPEDQFPVIGVIARWMEWKGIQHTIEAFKQTLTVYPDALLCLFGATANADYYGQLKRQLEEIPAKNYRIVEYEQNVFDLYRLFDVYVHVPVNPSCEAFGQTYVEALAAGIPSIFTLSGIAREFISGRTNALVVPFKDPPAIQRAVSEILRDQELRRKLIENGKASVFRHFTFDRYIATITELYNEKSS